jgi:hypothetical protein
VSLTSHHEHNTIRLEKIRRAFIATFAVLMLVALFAAGQEPTDSSELTTSVAPPATRTFQALSSSEIECSERLHRD